MKIIRALLAPNKGALWVAIVWTLGIVYLCLKPPSFESGVAFPFADKVVHFSFYFVFVWVWFRYLYTKVKQPLLFLQYVLLGAVVFGILIELAQEYLTTTRQADVWDVVANSIGGVFSTLLIYFVLRRKMI